jgi:hypothetical protein
VLGRLFALAVVCAAMYSIAPLGDSFADTFNAKAYGIRGKPETGPIESFQPIKALPPIDFRLPFDWSADPYADQTWRFRLHTLRIVDPALLAGDFDYAREVFYDWQQWHENCWVWRLCFARVTDQSWDDMATGIRASRLAYLLRSTGWNDERLIELAEQHATKLHDPDLIATNNHALFQLHGLAALCLDRRLRACDGVDAFIDRELDDLLDDQFAESGIHRENSPGYHFFIAEALARVAPLLEEFVPDLGAVIQLAEEKKPWLVHPDKTTVLLGDSTAARRKRLIFPSGNPLCRGKRSYREAPDCYFAEHFDDVGYVIIRSDWAIPPEDASMLFVQGGFFERTHRDADDFSFEWFEHGRKILSDSGLYALTRDEWEDYFNSTRAHNTVEVDGKDYTRSQELAYGNAVQSIVRSDKAVNIVMEVQHDIAWHRRELSYSPGRQLTVADTLRSDGRHRFVQWHHFTREFDVAGEAGRFQVSDGAMSVDVAVTSSCGERTSYETIKGQTEPRIQGWASVDDRERHPRWALGVVCEAETASFAARFTLADATHERNG